MTPTVSILVDFWGAIVRETQLSAILFHAASTAGDGGPLYGESESKPPLKRIVWYGLLIALKPGAAKMSLDT